MMMIEAARTSETLVNFYQTTRCYNPEDSHLHLLKYSITAAATYTTLHSFMSKKNKFLTKRRSLQNDLILHFQYQEIELIIVSSH
jgi:hypothetical protein